MNPKVDKYLIDGCGRCSLAATPACKVHKWMYELDKLRSIVLECGLTEELKWGVPCYTHNNKNILIVGAYKNYCSLGFFKGVLLKDNQNIFTACSKNSQSVRSLRFTNVQDIDKIQDVLKVYIFEAIEVEKAGLKVDFKKKPETIPDELVQKLNEDLILKSAFEVLTPGRQRGYIHYIPQAKHTTTRLSRIEKCIPKILIGRGLNDDYRSRK